MSDQLTTRTVDNRTVPAVGQWTIDPTHSTVAAVARHLMVTKVRGHFASFSGTINVAENPADSSVEVSIDAASITTGTEDRDNHLKSADFLDVESYPTLTFRSTSVEADGDKWTLTGDLTIRNITQVTRLRVRCEHEVLLEQKPTLLLGDRVIAVHSIDKNGTRPRFPLTGVPAGEYFVRLRVDGIDSLLIDYGQVPPIFDPARKVTINP